MVILVFATGLLLSALTALAIIPLLTRVAFRLQLVDTPDGKRKIHKEPIPVVGGIAIVSAFLVGLLYFITAKAYLPPALAELIYLPSFYFLICGLTIALVGLYDDMYGAHFGFKFFVQFAVAILFVYLETGVSAFGNPFTGGNVTLDVWLTFPIKVLWIVGIINAINLLDGMDGLASGIVLIVLGSLTASYAAMGYWEGITLVVVLTGAVLGFLRHNFNPARIFMGDTGSMFLGFILGAYALVGSTRAPSLLALAIPIIAMGLPIIDTGLAIVRRFLSRRHLFHPDKDHIHHRVNRKYSLTHRNTVLVLYAVSVVFGITAFLLAITLQQPVDNVWPTLLLCGSAVGIFFLLRMLGYLPSPRRTPTPVATKAPEPLASDPVLVNNGSVAVQDAPLSLTEVADGKVAD